VSRGATNIFGPTARLCGLPTWQGTGRINYNAPTEKSTTHGEGSNQLTRTEGDSPPRHTGAAKAAGDWRLGPTVYKVCSFRLEDSSFTSVTVQRRFSGAEVYRPRRLGECEERHRIRPRVRNSVPRRNEPSRTDCGALRPSYTVTHRAGSTRTHRPRIVPCKAREASN
jgi:hypothetical protein